MRVLYLFPVGLCIDLEVSIAENSAMDSLGLGGLFEMFVC